MDFYQLATQRYSVRRFSTRPVEEEKLEQILQAGNAAPTAKNYQPQRIYVLKSDQAREAVKQVTGCLYNPPLYLLVCGNEREGWVCPYNDRNGTQMDVGIVTTHMMLQATELGLGSTWIGWFDTQKTKELFDLPEEIEPYALLCLGYPAEDCRPAKLHFARKELSDLVTTL